MDEPSAALHERYFADVPLRTELPGRQSFYSTARAEQLLGWKHDLVAAANEP